jgi:hypothetical protein
LSLLAAAVAAGLVVGVGVVAAWPAGTGAGQVAGTPFLRLPEYPLLDLGEGRPGQQLEGTFTLANDGPAPLTFRTWRSCDCLRITPGEGVVEPGHQVRVGVALELARKGKDEAVLVRVTTNDPARPTADLRVVARCPAAFSASPASLQFGRADPAERPRQLVLLKPLVPLATTPRAAVSGPHLSAALHPAPTANEYVLEVVLTAPPPGPGAGWVHVFVEEVPGLEVWIPVTIEPPDSQNRRTTRPAS